MQPITLRMGFIFHARCIVVYTILHDLMTTFVSSCGCAFSPNRYPTHHHIHQDYIIHSKEICTQVFMRIEFERAERERHSSSSSMVSLAFTVRSLRNDSYVYSCIFLLTCASILQKNSVAAHSCIVEYRSFGRPQYARCAP